MSVKDVKDKVLPFLLNKKKSSTKSPSPKGVVDQGKWGKLDYQVFSRGVVHLSNNGFIFKKDAELFEDELDEMDLNKMLDGDEKRIKGSGDNDDLVFSCKNDDIELKLERKEYGAITKLKKILSLAKRSKKKEATK